MKIKQLLSKILPTQLVNLARDLGNKGQLENLESRVMMSVAQDAAGWTVVTPSADSRIVYVSSSAGSDTNSGLSADAPVKTLARAQSLMRANMPDHLLLKRGDTWNNENFANWDKGGRNDQEPMLIGAYGTGERPIVAPGPMTSGWTALKSDTINHLYIMGVHMVGQGGGGGIDRLSPGENFHIEDVKIEKFNVNIVVQGYYSYMRNLTVRRSLLLDAYPSGSGHSQGMYLNKTNGTLIEETVVDRSGWSNPDRSNATVFNHGIYMSAANDNAVVRRNFIANSSSHGLQMRGGGVVQDNVFVRNPIGFSFGLVNGATLHPGGVSGSITGNVVIESSDINATTLRGYAAEIAHIKPGGLVMRDNIFANSQSAGNHSALKLLLPSGANNPQDGVGIHDLTIENNIIYKWKTMMHIDPGYQWGGTGINSISNLTVRNNHFQANILDRQMILHDAPINTAQEHWENNTYWDTRSQTDWFRVKNIGTSVSDWMTTIEPTARIQKVPYVDPERGIASYNASIGGLASYDSFMTGLRSQSRDNWRSAYTAAAVIDYVRKGFATGASNNPTVSISAAAGAAEGSGAPGAFTVTRTGATTSALTLSYTVSGAATNGADYSTLSGTVTIPAGASSASINIYAIDDASYDPNELVMLSLVPSAGYDLGTAVASIAVADNDAAPLPNVSASAGLNVEEAKAGISAGSFVLTRTGSTLLPLVVNYRLEGTAAAGQDYVAPLGTAVFAPGAATASVSIMGIDDSAAESTENIKLVLLPGIGYTHSAVSPSINVLDNGDSAPDTTAPTAASSISNIAVNGGSSMQFTISFRDNIAINSTTLGNTDVLVTGPNGFAQTASLVGAQVLENRAVAVATYRISAPGGTWNSADNGAYTVSVNNGEVRDSSGNAVAAGPLTTFSVAIENPAPVPDYSAPSVAISAGNVTTTGAATYQFTVTYSDNVAIDVSTLGDDDLGVVLPGGVTYLARLVNVDYRYDGMVRNATYEVIAPGGMWDASDGGTYRIVSMPNGVFDTAGNGVTGTAGAVFHASFPGAAPTATLNPAHAGEGGGYLTFSVTYGGSSGISLASLGDDDLVVIGPNDYQQAARLVGLTTTLGNETIATYSITAPDGAWDANENGLYVVTMQSNSVSDATGVHVAQGDIGTLSLEAVEQLPLLPEVSVSVSDPSISEGGEVSFTFTRTGDTSSTLVAAFKLSGDAVNGIDYSGLGNAVWFAAGEDTVTVTMSSLDDHAVEAAESMIVTLAGLTDYTVGTATATVTIADNDIVTPIPVTRFSDVGQGDLSNFSPLNGSRWSVLDDGGNKRLFLNTTDYSNLNGGRPGEYALAKGLSLGNFVMNFQAKTAESLATNGISDFVIVFGFVDGNNYSYAMLNSNAAETKIFSVINGQRQDVATATQAGIADDNYHDIAIARSGSTVIVKVDGVTILQATDPRLARVGYTGVGSFNDSVYFDDINVQALAAVSAQPPSVSQMLSQSSSSSTSLNDTFNSTPATVLA